MPNHKNVNFEHPAQPILSLKHIKDNITNEKIKILYNHLPLSIIASFACSSVIFFALHHHSSIFKNGWYIAVIVISIFRFSFILIHKLSPQYPKLHLILFTFGTALSASCWGIIGSFLMPQNNLLQQMIIIIIISGVSSGAMQTLQANLTAAILFLILTILPLCIWLFMQINFEYYALGIAMTTYLFFCALSALRGNLLINQVLKLNSELTNKNSQLKRHEQDMNIINYMNERLQLCKSSIEAYFAIKIAAEELFVDFFGGLTITDAFGNQALVTQWGDKQTLNAKFSSDKCQALRSGNKYVVKNCQMDLSCMHYNILPEESYCIPLIIDSKSLGMINFNFPKKITVTNYKEQVMTVFSDAVKLALANIQLHETLQQEATHDPLTNLYNRRYLNEALSREFYRIIREKNSLCFAMLDLDNFKKFNDSYGHEAGDEVLKYIGALLTNLVRGNDIACRFGGEEFVLVFINTTIDNIMPYLEQIRKEIEKAEIYFNEELLPQITTSIGVAQAPEQGTTVNEIIQAADMALYSAKKAGRNRVMTTQAVVPIKGTF